MIRTSVVNTRVRYGCKEMSSTGFGQLRDALFKKYFYVTVGQILFFIGLAMINISENTSKDLCSSVGGNHVYANTTSLSCTIKENALGRDMTFGASFSNYHTGNYVKYPANVQIINPNGAILVNQNFSGTITLAVKATVLGNYKALVTYLGNSDPTYDKINTASDIQFGIVTGGNILGTELVYLKLAGALVNIAGLGLTAYGAIRLELRKRKASKAVQAV